MFDFQNWANENEGFISLLELMIITIIGGVALFLWGKFSEYSKRPIIICSASVRRYANIQLSEPAFRLTIKLRNEGKRPLELIKAEILNIDCTNLKTSCLSGLSYSNSKLLLNNAIPSIKPFGSDERTYLAHLVEESQIPQKMKIDIYGIDFHEIKIVNIERYEDELFICNYCGELIRFSKDLTNCNKCYSDLTK